MMLLKKYHIDHIWANDNMTKMSKLKKYLPSETEEIRNEFKNKSQFLPNLELLDQNPNIEKSDMLYDQWIDIAHPDITNDPYFNDNIIPKRNI